VFASESGADGLRGRAFGIEVPGVWTDPWPALLTGDKWAPGARYLLFLMNTGVDDEGIVKWSRVSAVRLGQFEILPPEAASRHYWALHCAGYRDDVGPISTEFWTAWMPDYIERAFEIPCKHSETP